ncbi:hypothetical protein [Thiomicrorhabdus sp.]|uniref:hypothetical protein n=1 Tax=Thiomicrorhabdus sp. TaxID=2039724 RepID=UPI002AA60B01|nr:hypothetical protein [Thiomicrorhabdus sp.]
MYQAIPLEQPGIKQAVKDRWDEMAESFDDEDMKQIIKADTSSSLESVNYNHAVVNTEDDEYVALIGVVHAAPINSHKVLHMQLNPKSNTAYLEEQEIGMMSTAQGIAGTIVALSEQGIIEHGMSQVKIFGRGHEMKTFFKLVVEWVEKHPINGFLVFNQGGWLVIQRTEE